MMMTHVKGDNPLVCETMKYVVSFFLFPPLCCKLRSPGYIQHVADVLPCPTLHSERVGAVERVRSTIVSILSSLMTTISKKAIADPV